MSALLLLLGLACGGAEDSGGEAGVCGRDPPLSWELWGQGFMATHCAGCHSSLLPEGSREGAPLGVDLDTYAGVLQWAERVEARALGEAPDMPPGGGPSTEELLLLAEWLGCGVAADLARLEDEAP